MVMTHSLVQQNPLLEKHGQHRPDAKLHDGPVYIAPLCNDINVSQGEIVRLAANQKQRSAAEGHVLR